jgi:hypothetical protein
LHHRLGHASKQKLLELLNNGSLEGVHLVGPRHLDNCYGCAVGKQARMPHPPRPGPQSTRTLELVHTDLMGPFQVRSNGGSYYVLTIIDDHTRYATTLMLNDKTKVYEAWKEWWAHAER